MGQKVMTGLSCVPGIGTVMGTVETGINAVALPSIKKPPAIENKAYYEAQFDNKEYDGYLLCSKFNEKDIKELGTTQLFYALEYGRNFCMYQKGLTKPGTQSGVFYSQDGRPVDEAPYEAFLMSIEIMRKDSVEYITKWMHLPDQEKDARLKFIHVFLDTILRFSESLAKTNNDLEIRTIHKSDIDRILIYLYQRVAYLEKKKQCWDGVISGLLRVTFFGNAYNIHEVRKGPFTKWNVAEKIKKEI